MPVVLLMKFQTYRILQKNKTKLRLSVDKRNEEEENLKCAMYPMTDS